MGRGPQEKGVDPALSSGLQLHKRMNNPCRTIIYMKEGGSEIRSGVTENSMVPRKYRTGGQVEPAETVLENLLTEPFGERP